MFDKLVPSMVLALALAVPAAAVATPEVEGAACFLDRRPGATLLIPYFEVDLDAADGKTTLMSIGNAGAEPAIAHVVLWTDWGVPTLAFDLLLLSQDLQSLNLRDVLAGGLIPETGGDGGFASCTDPVTVPSLDVEMLAALRAQYTGQPHPDDGLCWGSDRGETSLAVGFVTVDVLDDCATDVVFPHQEGYFREGGSGLASNANVLWGDYFYIEGAEDFAQGFEAVALRADPSRLDGPTFYQRVTFERHDARQPLGNVYRGRFLQGGPFDAGTELILWTGKDYLSVPHECGTEEQNFCRSLQLRAYDEGGDLVATVDLMPPGESETRVLDLGPAGLDLPVDFGFVEVEHFEIGACIQLPIGIDRRQTWMTPRMSARGRFSVGLQATQMEDGCTAIEF